MTATTSKHSSDNKNPKESKLLEKQKANSALHKLTIS